MEFYNDELYHHGIPGMKWGVKHGPPYPLSISRKSKAEKRRKQRDKKNKEQRKRDVKYRRSLTDKELRQKVERIKMEKELKKLTEEEISKGKKFAREVLTTIGKGTITTVGTGTALYGIKLATGHKFDLEEFGSYITTKRKK